MTEFNMTLWAAGLISGMGGFGIVKNNQTFTIRYQASTLVHKEAMLRLADTMHTNITEVDVKSGGEDKIAYKISCSGKPLHKAMIKMWPYLTTARKREYKRLRDELAGMLSA